MRLEVGHKPSSAVSIFGNGSRLKPSTKIKSQVPASVDLHAFERNPQFVIQHMSIANGGTTTLALTSTAWRCVAGVGFLKGDLRPLSPER